MPTQTLKTQAQPTSEPKILWQELEDAADIPEEADLPFLCQMLDQAITLVPEHLRLAVAGEAFVQLANIYACRDRFGLRSQTISILIFRNAFLMRVSRIAFLERMSSKIAEMTRA